MNTSNLPIQAVGQPQNVIEICTDDNLLVRIEFDGEVTYGETYTPDRAAQVFWKTLGKYAPDIDKPPVVLTPEEAYDHAMSIIG